MMGRRGKRGFKYRCCICNAWQRGDRLDEKVDRSHLLHEVGTLLVYVCRTDDCRESFDVIQQLGKAMKRGLV